MQESTEGCDSGRRLETGPLHREVGIGNGTSDREVGTRNIRHSLIQRHLSPVIGVSPD